MTIVQQWWVTYRKKGRDGHVCQESCKLKGKSKGAGDVFQGGVTGSTCFWGGDVGDDLPYGPGLGGGGFNTGYLKVSLGDIPRYYWIGFGGVDLWIRQYMKWGLKRWRHMF